ncbi:PaaI family thioesterase [Parvularcula marina]|uniref:PaaI family thioesterase n=1 Tax=Parvularcula marina TaxID=2292771 RepID=A0A371RG93_9PROT|nr:PaaI family thioesterase [Parvularcula marina]RFB04460.1 PaaI family thioesterase [Parvularcula marina]
MSASFDPKDLEAAGQSHLPGLLGLKFLSVEHGRALAELPVRQDVLAHNGYLHAGSVVTLADSTCGFGCMASLPEGAVGFTTIELKSNFLGTARDGVVRAEAKAVHLGRNTQLWDAEVTRADDGKTIALFRCTQMVLWPKP